MSLLLRAARGYDLLMMIALLLAVPMQWREWRIAPHAQRAGGDRPWLELNAKELPESVRDRRRTVLMSPSYALVRDKEPNFFERFPQQDRNFKLNPISKYAFSASAFRNSDVLQDVLHSKTGARWSSGSGRQEGGEWIQVRFSEPLAMSAVKLDVAPYVTDFPRGLEILSAQECEEGSPPLLQNYTMIFKRRPWEGEITYTDDGYPYMEPEAHVLAAFDGERLLKCLLFRQTGETGNFEWSITGIHIGQKK